MSNASNLICSHRVVWANHREQICMFEPFVKSRIYWADDPRQYSVLLREVYRRHRWDRSFFDVLEHLPLIFDVSVHLVKLEFREIVFLAYDNSIRMIRSTMNWYSEIKIIKSYKCQLDHRLIWTKVSNHNFFSVQSRYRVHF